MSHTWPTTRGWHGLEAGEIKSPTSRKRREKWGTRSLHDAEDEVDLWQKVSSRFNRSRETLRCRNRRGKMFPAAIQKLPASTWAAQPASTQSPVRPGNC